MNARGIITLALVLIGQSVDAHPKNNVQFGFSMGDWVGGHFKYMRKVSKVYLGLYLKTEDTFTFVDVDPDALNNRKAIGIPIDYKWISKDWYFEASSGVNISRTTFRDKDYSTKVVTETEKDSFGIPLEVAFGIKGEYLGLGLSPGYELNTLESNGYLAIRIWMGI